MYVYLLLWKQHKLDLISISIIHYLVSFELFITIGRRDTLHCHHLVGAMPCCNSCITTIDCGAMS